MKTIILAGGKSSRMGKNKALMKIGPMRLIDRLIHQFKPISNELILITNERQLYRDVPATLLTDDPLFQGEGPLAGLYTGLSFVKEGACLIVACDLPFASARYGLYMVEQLRKNKRDAVVPMTKRQIHPLFAAYDAKLANKAKETLQRKKRSLKALLDEVNVQYVTMEQEQIVWNMNTMKDYDKAVRMFEGGNEFEL